MTWAKMAKKELKRCKSIHFFWCVDTHRIHGTGIFTYICHTNQPLVGKNYHIWILWDIAIFGVCVCVPKHA